MKHSCIYPPNPEQDMNEDYGFFHILDADLSTKPNIKIKDNDDPTYYGVCRSQPFYMILYHLVYRIFRRWFRSI